MTRVSVITPAFNAALFIKECVQSVAASVTLGRFEVEQIVVEDGSTDSTKNLLQNMAQPRLKMVYLDKNSGQSLARNAGVTASQGDYLFFLDADDVLFGSSLLRLVTTARRRRAAWVYGDFVRGDAQMRYSVGEDYYGWQFRNPESVLEAMYTGKHFFQQCSLYGREVFDRVGGFDPELRMAEDFELATKLLLAGVLPGYIPGPLYMHRNHGSNLSVEHAADRERHRQDVARLYAKYQHQIKAAVGGTGTRRIGEYLGI